jgi:Holliday junction resolvase RusA-like endonuclease
MPDETTEYESRVAIFARRALAANPDWQKVASNPDVALRAHVHFIRAKRRSDIDNFLKAALDGLKKANDYREDPKDLVRGKPRKIWVAGVFDDDARITQVLASMHTDPKDEPRTEIVVETANVVLQEPLWMRCAREAGWKRPQEEQRAEGH